MKLLNCFPILLIILTVFGCSKSPNPINPSSDDSVIPSKTGLNAISEPEVTVSSISPRPLLPGVSFLPPGENHNLWGIYRIRIWEDGTVEIIPNRNEQKHVDVTKLALNTPGCFKLTVDIVETNVFDFHITLKNPTGIKAYDVTGIVRSSGDIEFLNPDGYTLLWSKLNDETPNPFAAWKTGVGNRAFPGHQSFEEILRFRYHGLTKFTEMDYVIQASWPGNQEEAYEISDFVVSDDFLDNGTNTVDIQCHVYDWQNDISEVKIDLTPIGGNKNVQMTNMGGGIWKKSSLTYQPTGQGIGTHNLLIEAKGNGVSNYNYVPVTVVSGGPIMQGPFIIQYQNLPLAAPDGPTDGMDIAVMGASDGTQVGMVFGSDDTFHFWSTDYTDGTFGLYKASDGTPITPLNMPNFRFDFADTTIPDTSGDSIFTLSWGESNSSNEVLDPDTVPPIIARQRLSLWYLTADGLKLTSNILVLGQDPGPPQTFDCIVRPADFASGFLANGFLYTALIVDSGDTSAYPFVGIMGMIPPLDWQSNTELITGGYEVDLTEGSGAGKVNRNAIVGFDIDDSGVLQISGGWAGNAVIGAVEAGSENQLEIAYGPIEANDPDFKTVNLPSAPLDVEILPISKLGEPSNWFCVLCADNKVRFYDYEGNLAFMVGGPPYLTGTALRLDVDDKNMAVHVLHQGASNPLVTVYKYQD